MGRSFVEELLARMTSCCYWIEEAMSEESGKIMVNKPTVLFDKDHFFHVKNLWEKNGFTPLFDMDTKSSDLALVLDDFDLVLEVFLQCQSMNTYISTRDQEEMMFSL